MDALYEKDCIESFSVNLRVPKACDPKPAPQKSFTTDAPVSMSATYSVKKAHMTSEEFAAANAPTEDPMRTGRKGHKVLPGQFNVTWTDLEEELGFKIDPKSINLGGIGEGCSDPKVLNRYVATTNGPKYYGLHNNQKLWYSKEPAEMLFHEPVTHDK
eukprot:CAMPEP_0185189012 /NCGR_PEP_ID=MMETSP1140-20130426/5770_1 /TAXON_ID=298111 /ORGANISM="Pavlova sp., Strain CCMP459" /LENGTH=157 /DNA_ID=CAMNT_0027755541 /DNA_START=28 /DNA_END=501 /DNA_ORIENTATION=+